jgi:hypothetical protein
MITSHCGSVLAKGSLVKVTIVRQLNDYCLTFRAGVEQYPRCCFNNDQILRRSKTERPPRRGLSEMRQAASLFGWVNSPA